MTALHEVVETWLREGGSGVQDAQVREHLRTCAVCHAEVASVEATRALFPDPGDVVSEPSAHAIRFRLQAEARGSRTRAHDEVRGTRRLRGWAIAAAALLVVSAVAFARYGLSFVHEDTRSRAQSRAAEPHPSSNRRSKRSVEPPLTETSAPQTPPESLRPRPPRVRKTPSKHGGTTANATPVDVAFGDAWQLYRAGHIDAASQRFDALLDRGLGEREADVLFWSARAHLEAGRRERAVEKLEQLLKRYPSSWHANHAHALLRSAR